MVWNFKREIPTTENHRWLSRNDFLVETKERVSLITKAALDKKGEDVVVLDMKRLSQICDFFIIASGKSARQVKAISDNIVEKARQRGVSPLHIEGYTESRWVLLDFHDIVAHIFVQEARAFYALERLWGDAVREDYNSGEADRRC